MPPCPQRRECREFPCKVCSNMAQASQANRWPVKLTRNCLSQLGTWHGFSCTDAALGSYVASSGGRKAESQGVSSSCLYVCAISEGEGEGEAQAQAEGQGEGRALRWPEQRVARCVSKDRAGFVCIQRVTRLRVQRPRKKGVAVRLSMPVRIVDRTDTASCPKAAQERYDRFFEHARSYS